MSTLSDSIAAALALAQQQDALTAALQQQVADTQAALQKAIADGIAAGQRIVTDASGKTNVTPTLQAFLNRGDAYLPAGDYLIDPLAELSVRAGATLTMDPLARLLSIPTGATHSALLTAEAGSTIIGGRLVGERFAHDYSASGTHEWNYGIVARDGATVSGVDITDFTGDGLIVVGDYVYLSRLRIARSRRNNMSVFTSIGLRASQCRFEAVGLADGQTGAAKGPWANVDIEPDKGEVADALFEDCAFLGGQSAGLLAWTRANTSGAIRGVVARRCTMVGNPNGFSARGDGGPVEAALYGCTLGRAGKGTAARIALGASITLGSRDPADANTFIAPLTTSGAARAPFDLVGRDGRTAYDIYTPKDITTGALATPNVGLNHFA